MQRQALARGLLAIVMMKLRTFLICLFVFFLAVLFLGRVSVGGAWPQKVDFSYAVTLTLSSAGGLMAVISVFKLFQHSTSGLSLEQIVPLVVALLGGVLLYQANWGVAIAIGAVATGAIVTRRILGSKDPQG